MQRFSSVILFLGSMFFVTFSAAATENDRWWSDKYHTWFEKNGRCSQYDYTEHDTCNTAKDNLQCDWDRTKNTCYSTDSGDHHNQWWSDKYYQWFDKYGRCDQYNRTDSDTCNTPKDNLNCDWDRHSYSCKPAKDEHANKWWSDKYGRWFEKDGSCKQYSYTDSDTCNTPHDKMQCDWDRHRNECYQR